MPSEIMWYAVCQSVMSGEVTLYSVCYIFMSSKVIWYAVCHSVMPSKEIWYAVCHSIIQSEVTWYAVCHSVMSNEVKWYAVCHSIMPKKVTWYAVFHSDMSSEVTWYAIGHSVIFVPGPWPSWPPPASRGPCPRTDSGGCSPPSSCSVSPRSCKQSRTLTRFLFLETYVARSPYGYSNVAKISHPKHGISFSRSELGTRAYM